MPAGGGGPRAGDWPALAAPGSPQPQAHKVTAPPGIIPPPSYLGGQGQGRCPLCHLLLAGGFYTLLFLQQMAERAPTVHHALARVHSPELDRAGRKATNVLGSTGQGWPSWGSQGNPVAGTAPEQRHQEESQYFRPSVGPWSCGEAQLGLEGLGQESDHLCPQEPPKGQGGQTRGSSECGDTQDSGSVPAENAGESQRCSRGSPQCGGPEGGSWEGAGGGPDAGQRAVGAPGRQGGRASPERRAWCTWAPPVGCRPPTSCHHQLSSA